jgi:hypothetical protein
VGTRVARKRSVLARHPVHPHPHRDQGFRAVAVGVGVMRQESGAHLGRASNYVSEVRNAYDRGLVENWAACLCRRKSTNTQTMRSTEVVTGAAEVGSIACI